MEGRGSGGGGRDKGSSPPLKKASKFSVYQNAAFSAALTANSLQPSNSTLLRLSSLSSASAFALLAIFSRCVSLSLSLAGFGRLGFLS